MRSICHNLSDDKVRELLSNTVSAMRPGYSRLLINDWVIADTGSALVPALLDINMMALLSGMEGTESHWNELLGSIGVEINSEVLERREGVWGLSECVCK
jgi:hypothetical protein